MTEKKMKNDWVMTDKKRALFWVSVKEYLGHLSDSHAAAHAACDVDSMKEFAGSLDDAIALVMEYAANELQRERDALSPQDPEHAEARVIAFCDLYAPSGTRISLTAREGARLDDLVATTLALTAAVETLVNVFGFGAAPQKYAPNNNKRPAAAKPPAPARPAPPPAPSSGEHIPPPPSPIQPTGPLTGNSGSGGIETFAVDSITAQMTPNGNRNYAVRGGRVKKHGATAWPEIAEPQLEALTEYNPVNLEIGKPWDVTGFGIRAVGEIPPGKVYPSKITAFAPST